MTYKLPKQYCNQDWMNKCKFFYSHKFSSKEESIFQKRISVWRQGDMITLEARILICLETGDVTIDVFDAASHGRYAPYYLKPSYYDELLSVIDKRIDEELSRDKIEKEPDND